MPTYNEQLSIGSLPHYHASLTGRRDKPAIIYQDRRITWKDLSDRTARLANALESRGLTRGSKVGAYLKNCPEYVELIYALAGLGVAVVPMNYRFVERELVYAVNHSEVDAIVVDSDLLETFEKARPEFERLNEDRIFVVGESESYVSYEGLLDGGSTSQDYLTAEEWDLFWLAFTGGTTGFPKACEVPHRAAMQTWFGMTIEFQINVDDVSLIAGPFYHGLGFFFGLQQLMVGGTIVLMRDFDASGALAAIEREQVTYTPMAPTMYNMILNVPDREDYDLSSIQGLISAAAPLLTTTKDGLLELFEGAGLYEFYGATEAGFYSVLKPADQLRKQRCVGQPFWNCWLKILDEDGNELPPGEVGEIYKFGSAIGARYYKNPEQTEAMFQGDWITSGDMGRLDEEGYLYIVDRKKDMIISGGSNIFPAEIEEVISWHSDVLEVAVVGAPDEQWGESVKAYVVRKPGADLDEDTVVEHCREHLASYKKPRHVEFLDDLPRNAAGKILKRELRDRDWGDASRKV